MAVFTSAAVLTFYGKIATTVNVEQAVTLTGGDCADNICPEDAGTMYSGDTLVSDVYTLTNLADTPRDVDLATTYNPGVASGEIVTTYLQVIPYSFNELVDIEGSAYDLDVTVTEDGDWMVFTFDFPVEEFTGDGNLNVGLIIATGGEGNGPSFQIHNNDGADSAYPFGDWLMSPWGPTINDGWMGWHSGDTNTPVTSLSWVEATGNRNVPHNNGVMEIRIKKSELGESLIVVNDTIKINTTNINNLTDNRNRLMDITGAVIGSPAGKIGIGAFIVLVLVFISLLLIRKFKK